jgi:PAS domain-containing protein
VSWRRSSRPTVTGTRRRKKDSCEKRFARRRRPGSTLSMSTTHAIVMADTEGHIVHWNAGAQHLFGYTPDEALGQSLDLIVPPAFRDRHWMGFRKGDRHGHLQPRPCHDEHPRGARTAPCSPFPDGSSSSRPRVARWSASSGSTRACRFGNALRSGSFPCDVWGAHGVFAMDIPMRRP